MSGRRYEEEERQSHVTSPKQYPIPDYNTIVPPFSNPRGHVQRDSYASNFSAYSGKVERAEQGIGQQSPLKVIIPSDDLRDDEMQSDTSSVNIGRLPTITKSGQKKESDYKYNTAVGAAVPPRSPRRPTSEIVSSKMQTDLDKELARFGKNKRSSITNDLDLLMQNAKSIGDENQASNSSITSTRSISPIKFAVNKSGQVNQLPKKISSEATPTKIAYDAHKPGDLHKITISNPNSGEEEPNEHSTGENFEPKHSRIVSEPIERSEDVQSRGDIISNPNATNLNNPAQQTANPLSTPEPSTITPIVIPLSKPTDLNISQPKSDSKRHSVGRVIAHKRNLSLTGQDNQLPGTETAQAEPPLSNPQQTTDQQTQLRSLHDKSLPRLPRKGSIEDANPGSPTTQPLIKQSHLPPRPTRENITRAREVSNATKARADLFGIEDASDFETIEKLPLAKNEPEDEIPAEPILNPHVIDQPSDISSVEKDILNAKPRQLPEETKVVEEEDDEYYDIGNPIFIHNPSNKNKKDKTRKKNNRKSKQDKELKPFSYATLVNLLESMNGTVIGEEFSQLNLPIKEKQLIEKIMDSLSRLTADMVIDANRYEVGIERLEKALRALEGFL